jgi:hypothetical protein
MSIRPEGANVVSLIDQYGRLLFEGIQRERRAQMAFAAGSGIEAGFGLNGAVCDDFDFRGAGSLVLAGHRFDHAAISAKRSGVAIRFPICWGSAGAGLVLHWLPRESEWFGRAIFFEEFVGKVTGQHRLAVTVSLRWSPGSPGSEQVEISMGMGERLFTLEAGGGDLAAGSPKLRELALRALRRQLADAAQALEQKLDAAIEKEELTGTSPMRADASAPFWESTGVGSDTPSPYPMEIGAGAYLTAPAPSRRARTVSLTGGYLESGDDAAVQPRAGARALRQSPLVHGYPGPSPGGYLTIPDGSAAHCLPEPDTWRGGAGPLPAITPLSDARSMLAKLRPDSPSQRAAEELLRTKDILRGLPQ